MKIALLSNVVMDLLAKALSHDVYLPEGFDTWQLEILNGGSAFNTERFGAAFVILHCKDAKKNWHDYAAGETWLDERLSLLKTAAMGKPECNFFIANLDIAVDVIRPVSEPQPERAWEYHWQSGVCGLSREYSNIYLFDLKSLVEEIGRAAFYSPKLWYAGASPYSLKAMKAISAEMDSLIRAPAKKVFVTDLDNTLWGGVCGEGDISLAEFKEGARFYDLQLRLKELKQTGALLAIASRNNEEDACPVINNHPHMVLRAEDFAAARINWNNKPDNLRELAQELNVGLDSFVFLDDNPMERGLMRGELPEVTTADFPEDTALLEQTVFEIYRRYFRVLRLTGEDLRKTQIYRQEAGRKRLREAVSTPMDYIRALEMEVFVKPMSAAEIDRVVQLCNKTNQFNLTTTRYDRQSILSLANARVLTIHSRDKYGDSGLIGVMILKESADVEIDSFLLSCRVMGRFIEDYVFTAVAKYYKARGFSQITARFIPTAKNKPVERLYDSLGFDVVSRTSQMTSYVFDLSDIPERDCCYKSFIADLEEPL